MAAIKSVNTGAHECRRYHPGPPPCLPSILLYDQHHRRHHTCAGLAVASHAAASCGDSVHCWKPFYDSGTLFHSCRPRPPPVLVESQKGLHTISDLPAQEATQCVPVRWVPTLSFQLSDMPTTVTHAEKWMEQGSWHLWRRIILNYKK